MSIIKKKLEEQGKTIYKLARFTGESDPRMNYIVNHRNYSKELKLYIKIAEFLDCSIDDLI